jgi:predicted nucleic acid-binding protein
VVDASVVAKWILVKEEHQEIAIKIKKDYVAKRVELSSLDFVVEEVANALWKACKLERISRDDTVDALKVLGTMGINLLKLDWSRVAEVMGIAFDLGTTVYDASYVYISDEFGLPLITADRRLYETARNSFKVVYIGDYQ